MVLVCLCNATIIILEEKVLLKFDLTLLFDISHSENVMYIYIIWLNK